MTAKLWSNVAVAVQTALATSQNITNISKASPGVVTYDGSDTFANGDIVLLTVQGMHQVNARLFRVANVVGGSNTFELEGEDTTDYDTFSSGTVEEVTFGATMSTLTGLSASGGDFEFIDVTTIHDNVRKQIPGAAAPATYNFESLWDVADAGLLEMKEASDNKDLRAVRITFADGQKIYFTGYIGCTLLAVGSAQDKVTTPVVITGFGRPTVYAT